MIKVVLCLDTIDYEASDKAIMAISEKNKWMFSELYILDTKSGFLVKSSTLQPSW
jgi:hypothetical protein